MEESISSAVNGGPVEEWRCIPGYSDRYQVSNLGRFRSLPYVVHRGCGRGYFYTTPGTIYKMDTTDSYKVVEILDARGVKRKKGLHRLVLEAFVGPCPDGMEACHFPDRNRANNQLTNLSWRTHVENTMHRLIHGTDFRGAKCPTAKLTDPDKQVPEIHRLCGEGWSKPEIGVVFGLTGTAIGNILYGKSYISSQPPPELRHLPLIKKGPRPGKARGGRPKKKSCNQAPSQTL